MKKMGYLFTGLALGVAISAVSPVMASAVKTISAKVNNTVSVVLNGEKVQLKTQPIEYNNLNYLPVGEIGRALGLGVNYDKTKDAINITSQEQIGSTSPTPTQTTTPLSGSEQTVKEDVPKVKIGESITRDGITVKIDKIEYMPEGLEINHVFYPAGFKLFVNITNNDETPISGFIKKFSFKTDSPLSDSRLNESGNTLFLKIGDKDYQIGDQLIKGQTLSGYLYYQTNQNAKIQEVSYSIGNSSNTFGVWTIQ